MRKAYVKKNNKTIFMSFAKTFYELVYFYAIDFKKNRLLKNILFK